MKIKLFIPALCFSGIIYGLGCQDNQSVARMHDLPDEGKKLISLKDCEKCIVLADQSQNTVAIADTDGGDIIWEWSPDNSNIDAEHVQWFTHLSEAKVVYGLKYILSCASGGGVALIRIADKKTVFYGYAGGNTHSVEILPDGNIVSASSTGNYLTLFYVDTLHFPDGANSRKIPIKFGHNVVWEAKNQLLWSAGGNKLYSFEYNFSCTRPNLTVKDSLQLPGDDAHDLFPVYGKDSRWFTNTTAMYYIDMVNKKVIKAGSDLHKNIKSVSSGPPGYPVIIMKPKEKWWSDEVIDMDGNSVFQENDMKAYKARWFLPNAFSYPENDSFHICND